MELLKVYNALLRRKWLFLQAIVFFTIGAVILAKILPKQYEAAAKISVESSDASLSILGEMDLGEMASSLSGSSDDMETKIALAQMRPILDEVIWRLQLRNQYLSNWGDGELLPGEKLLAPGIDGEILAMPSISIEQQQGTDILIITATSNFPELSALLADTVVDVYLSKSKEQDKAETQQALQFINDQLPKIETSFDLALQNVASAQQREQVIDLDSEMKAAVTRVSELISLRTQLDAEIDNNKAQMREKGRINSRESSEKVSPSSTAFNSLVRELKDQEAQLLLKRKVELMDKTEKHPDVVMIDQQLAEVRKQLDAALTEQHDLDPITQSLEMELAGLREKRVEVEGEIANTVAEFGAYPDKMRKITQLQLAAEATEAIYQSLLEQQYEIQIAEAMTPSDMRQVEYAKLPEVPSAPRLLVYIILGCFCGIAFGFGLVFLMEYIDDSVKDQEDLKLVWPLNMLGMVPLYNQSAGKLINVLPATDPLFEAFRNIRNSIAFASVDNPINVMTVTSCAPGEGKSTFSMNLAICMAQDGQKVVVIDCDLRRPTVHRAFPTLSNEKGVANVLSQQLKVEEALQATPVPGLMVVSSGPLPNNPGRLVESLRLREVISELTKHFDMVIVDAPPILAVGDALSLSRSTRALVMVVEWGKTTRRMLGDVRDRCQSAGVEPIGMIFNKVDVRTSRYGTYYRNYANYYSSEGTGKGKGTKKATKKSGGAR
jgi:capsular exopolysaccharide synthesis family protein